MIKQQKLLKTFFMVTLFLISAMMIAIAPSNGAFAATKAGWPDQLRVMAGPPGGNWFALGTALAETWTKEGMPKTTSTSGGGVANIINEIGRAHV